jgi:hypothetical protein
MEAGQMGLTQRIGSMGSQESTSGGAEAWRRNSVVTAVIAATRPCIAEAPTSPR